MTLEDESRIQQRAYLIWEQAGRPGGCDLEHWFQALSEEAGAAAKRSAEPDATQPDATQPDATGGGASAEANGASAASVPDAGPAKETSTRKAARTGKDVAPVPAKGSGVSAPKGRARKTKA